MGRKLIIVLVLTLAGISGFSQQNTLITHYMFNNMAFNPGFAGSSEGICVTGLMRQQWIGFKTDNGGKVAPQTYFLSIHSPLRFVHGGVSGYIEQDEIAQFSTTKLKVGYAYQAEIGSGKFGAGLQVNFINLKVKFGDSASYNPNDQGDPALQEYPGEASDFMVDLALGVFYKVPDKYYIGISADNLLQTKGKTTSYQLRRHYYLTGGYNFVFPNHPAFELQPSALIEFDGAALQFNLGALVEYDKKFWGGLEYRYQDAVCILAGGNINIPVVGIFKIGVSYDIATSSMTRYSYGGVEVMLNYCFRLKTEKFRKSYKNTRFL